MQTSPLQKSSHLHKQNTWNTQGGSTSDLVSQDAGRDQNPLMCKKTNHHLLFKIKSV